MSYKRDCEHGSQVGKCYICDLVEAENRIAELEKTIKSLTDGVTHFHKSHGDMNPLLTAYIEALKEQGQ